MPKKIKYLSNIDQVRQDLIRIVNGYLQDKFPHCKEGYHFSARQFFGFFTLSFQGKKDYQLARRVLVKLHQCQDIDVLLRIAITDTGKDTW